MTGGCESKAQGQDSDREGKRGRDDESDRRVPSTEYPRVRAKAARRKLDREMRRKKEEGGRGG